MDILLWMGIALCICQSAMFSGLNLAFFTVSKLELEIEVAKNNRHAKRVLALRQDANFLLVTILWGNVGVNVLLALLSGSALSGAAAFLFSTVLITVCGEIVPQAYLSRRPLRAASLLSPVIRFYQVLLYPVAKPTALALDRWLGPEAISYLKERDIRKLLKLHMDSSASDIERVEGQGALNFLALDDIPLAAEGEPVDPDSVLRMDFQGGLPRFPDIRCEVSDRFLQRIHASGRKWVILTDDQDRPQMVLDSDEFIRDALFGPGRFNPYRHCHRPIVAGHGLTAIGDVITRLKVRPEHGQDDVVDHDVILLWEGSRRRVITGADVLGRLLRGIVRNSALAAA